MDPSTPVNRAARFCPLLAIALGGVMGVGVACGDATGGALLNADAGDGSIVGCNTIAQLGDQVEIQTLAPGTSTQAGVLWAGVGADVFVPTDSIPDGTYTLVKMELVPRAGIAGPTNVLLSQTIRVAGENMQIVQSDPSGESRSSGTFTIANAQLTRRDSCVVPALDGGDVVTTASVAANPDGLVLVTRTSTGVALVASYLRKSDG